MSNLEVVIKYNSWPARLLLIATMTLAPFWALAAPVAAGLLIITPLFNLLCGHDCGVENFSSYLSLLVGWFAMFTAGAGFTLCFADNRLRISKDALVMPLFMASIPRFQRAYGWEEILKIDVTAEKNFRKALLVLYLKGRSPIKLKMRCFESQQLEELFLALEVWGRQSEIGTRMVELQNQLRNDGESSSSSLSYTALWESELSSRFGTTIFTPLEPGACLQEGRLKVIRQLSFGGLSAIYLCQIDGRDLAVLKESVTPEGTRSDIREKALEHFRREAAHLIKLDHPRIIKVMDFFVEDGRTYLLLEYLEGLDLRQYVRQNGPVALDQALLFGIQIARILEYLHTQEPPLIHRDIAPDNIVRLSDETLILIDFGAANEFIGTVTGTLVGKQAYISPEQFRGKSVVQSDLYALGGTLYFLLTGEDPEPLSVSRLNSHGLSVCAEMDELIAELTALSVADRVPSAEAARRRLESILRERRTAAEVASSSLAKA